MIDVRSMLSELGIDFKESGKNVSHNDINIDCPFCYAEKHLGISRHEGKVNCWVCSFEGLDKYPSLIKVLVETTGLSWREVKNVASEHGWKSYSYETEEVESKLATKCWLPKEACVLALNTERSKKAVEYLLSRGFDEKIIDKHRLGYAEDGPYRKRIIIPIIFNDELVAFTSRAYDNSEDNRYKHSPLFMSSERIKNLLYNYDSAKNYKHTYLLEGPTDCWRMGDDSMGVFKSALSSSQRKLLIKLNLESLTIAYDPFATARAYAAADDLSPFISKIKVVRLEGKRDVADRSRDEVLEIEKKTPLYRG